VVPLKNHPFEFHVGRTNRRPLWLQVYNLVIGRCNRLHNRFAHGRVGVYGF
jgi:hypothetical protein